MKVLILGATGMLGQGVLRECLLDPGVEQVITVGRSPAGLRDPKLHEIVRVDFQSLPIEHELVGVDACFFCLGVSSTGMPEEAYARITYGFTLSAAQTLSRLHPGMTFIYVSGKGTDSTEKGRVMWARVKGRTENALLRTSRPICFAPASSSRWTKSLPDHVLPDWLSPRQADPSSLRAAFPNQVLTTRDIGRAMLAVARHGSDKRILETADIRALLQSA